MTHVLINGLSLNSQFTGIGNYVENLVASLTTLQLDFLDVNFLVASGYQGSVQSNEGVKVQPVQIDSTNRLNRIFFENFSLPEFSTRSFDLFHSPSYLLPFFPPEKSIVTVHDLIAIDFPQYSKNETALYHKIFLRRSLRKAKRIIAVSETVKRAIIKKYSIDADKISVVYHGVNPAFLNLRSPKQLLLAEQKYRLPGQFILFVGNIEPKKNLIRLFQAFDLLKRETGYKHKLVIAGKIGWKYKEIFAELHRLRLQNDVMFLGYVHEYDLPSVYQLADLFVFPSLYEGFGIPLLEAMASQVPVVSSNAGALPEVAGGACESFDPLNVREMAEKMMRVLSDGVLRDKLVKEGTMRVKEFTWEKAAVETARVYESVMNEPPRPA